jgi:hypothetical protein
MAEVRADVIVLLMMNNGNCFIYDDGLILYYDGDYDDDIAFTSCSVMPRAGIVSVLFSISVVSLANLLL